MIKVMYQLDCGSHKAWDESNTEEYIKCTKKLFDDGDTPQIKNAICEIQEVAKRNSSVHTSLAKDIWYWYPEL